LMYSGGRSDATSIASWAFDVGCRCVTSSL
jgi:hypothetical protein